MADQNTIQWLDLKESGFVLYLDGQNLVLEKLIDGIPEDTQDLLLKSGFREEGIGYVGQYSMAAIFCLSKLPGAEMMEVEESTTHIEYREILQDQAQALIDSMKSVSIDDGHPDPPEIETFLNHLEIPASLPPDEDASSDQNEEPDPLTFVSVPDVAVFSPRDPSLRAIVGVISEIGTGSSGDTAYYVLVAGQSGSTHTERLWAADYGIQVVEPGFTWNGVNGIRRVEKKAGDTKSGYRYHVLEESTDSRVVLEAWEIGEAIECDTADHNRAIKETAQADTDPKKPNLPTENQNVDHFVHDIPEPRKSRIAGALNKPDGQTTRAQVVEELVSKGYRVGLQEMNSRNRRGLDHEKYAFLDTLTKTELDYATYLESLSLNSTDSLNDAPQGSVPEPSPWAPGEEFKVQESTRDVTVPFAEGARTMQGRPVIFKDYPGFEFVVYEKPDKEDAPSGRYAIVEFITGLAIFTFKSSEDKQDTVILNGLTALRKNTPTPADLEKLVDSKEHFNTPPEPEDDRDVDLKKVTFAEINRVSAQDLLSLIRLDDPQNHGYALYRSNVMEALAFRIKDGTLMPELGWPEDPHAVYIHRETGEKKEYQSLGHGTSFFEMYQPEGLSQDPHSEEPVTIKEETPSEEIDQEAFQGDFDSNKQALRNAYRAQGYTLYYKPTDETWNLTERETRVIDGVTITPGEVFLTTEKEVFMNDMQWCLARIKELYEEFARDKKREGNDSKNTAIEQKTGSAAPEALKKAHTENSVAGRPQRAILQNGTIELQNKSGRKIIARCSFSVNEWNGLEDKQAFLDNLGIVPHEDPLRGDLLMSQAAAINEVCCALNENPETLNENKTSLTLIGMNAEGTEVHLDTNGNRILLDNGTRTSAPMALSPDCVMTPYTAEELFADGRVLFLTSEELSSFSAPAKTTDFPTADEILAATGKYLDNGDVNLRRVLMSTNLPSNPESLLATINRKTTILNRSLKDYTEKYTLLAAKADPEASTLATLTENIADHKGRLEALARAAENIQQNYEIEEACGLGM